MKHIRTESSYTAQLKQKIGRYQASYKQEQKIVVKTCKPQIACKLPSKLEIPYMPKQESDILSWRVSQQSHRKQTLFVYGLLMLAVINPLSVDAAPVDATCTVGHKTYKRALRFNPEALEKCFLQGDTLCNRDHQKLGHELWQKIKDKIYTWNAKNLRTGYHIYEGVIILQKAETLRAYVNLTDLLSEDEQKELRAEVMHFKGHARRTFLEVLEKLNFRQER